jgi:glycosyltransferase involved in cell wall biosynthesis
MTPHLSDGQPRRIVILVKRFPRLSETFILNEFLELRRQGVPVELYAIMNPGEGHSHPEALALIPEVVYLQTGSIWSAAPAVLRTVRRHPWGSLRAFGWTLTRHTRAALRNCAHAMVLVDLLADGEPAHLHAHFLHSPAAIAFIARKVSGQRYSLSGHAKDIYTTLPENLVIRCRDAEFVTTCTEANRQHLVDEIGVESSKVWLCRHGVNAERFSSDRSNPRTGRIVSVGRLVPKKGFDVLIRACGQLHRRGIEFELRIVGGGPLRDELRALAAEEGIGHRVHLLGSKSQTEVAAELAAAELFALSPVVMPDGDRDGIPNVLLEAMAAGVPVVVSAVSGIPELLTDEINARMVAQGRPDLLAGALAALLSDAEQRSRLATAGRELILANWSWPSAVLPLRELLVDTLTAPAEQVVEAAPYLVALT